MSKTIELPHARLEDLDRLHDFIEQACAEAGADDSVAFALRLAMEEACTNIIMHGYEGTEPGPITLTLEPNAHQIALTLQDRARPFSPDQAPEPDLHSGWEERQVGGLGWHLIRQTMDEILYQPNPGGGNILTLIKKI